MANGTTFGGLSITKVRFEVLQGQGATIAEAVRLSHGIAGYVATVNDKHGNDLRNPHVHFVFSDVQQKTGGRSSPK
ncbi:hypothetical protein ACS3QZ_14220 [Shimia sp. W99]